MGSFQLKAWLKNHVQFYEVTLQGLLEDLTLLSLFILPLRVLPEVLS